MSQKIEKVYANKEEQDKDEITLAQISPEFMSSPFLVPDTDEITPNGEEDEMLDQKESARVERFNIDDLED